MDLPKFNKKNILKFANELYNPKTGEYTKLCSGYLTHGVDKDECRVMHCGLGELYYHFEGKHPGKILSGNVDIKQSEGQIAKHFSNKPSVTNKTQVTKILNSIPGVNDAYTFVDTGGPYEKYKKHNFKTRAQNVAKKIRSLAKYVK